MPGIKPKRGRTPALTAATLIVACLSIATLASHAQPSILSYRGNIQVDGKPFNGMGHFTFAVIDGHGVILWSSGEFPLPGKTNIPATALRVAVMHGNYGVRLGDTRAGMMPLEASVLRSASAARLRIWFNDGQRGWQVADSGVSLGQVTQAAPTRTNADAAASGKTEALLAEIRDLRARVERLSAAQQRPAEAAPAIVTVPIGNGPTLGQANAPLVLIEFTDFQCAYCKRFHETTMPEVVKNFVETGKLRIVSRSLPLAFHTNAPAAALAALCANAQGKYWEMRDKLFGGITNLTRTSFIRHAQELQLDMKPFLQCLNERAHAGTVEADAADAARASITGTPSFVLGRASGTNVTGQLIVGTRPYGHFAAEINKLLEAKQ